MSEEFTINENLNYPFWLHSMPLDHSNQYFEKHYYVVLKNKKYHNKVLMGKFHWMHSQTSGVCLKDLNKAHV